MTIKTEIRNHWDENTCDQNNRGNFNELDKNRPTWFPYLEKELRMTTLNNKSILEIGVGSAIESCTVLRNSRPENYTLYDISPKTLDIAKSHLQQHHPDKEINYINGDMEQMDLPDNVYDRVHAIGSIHHTLNPDIAISEISRVMKYGAEFLFMLYCADSIRYRLIIPYMILKNRGRFAKTKEEFVRKLDGETNPIGKAYTKKQIKEWCSQASLEVKEMNSYYKGFCLYVYGVKQ